jgi:prefoldin subunit 5
MDFEQRIEKLVERHEALTQTVELLAHDVSEMRVNMGDIQTAISKLVKVAEMHDRRLTNLEGGGHAG